MAFFSLVAGMSLVSGFTMTLMLAKRRDSEMFDKVVSLLLFVLEDKVIIYYGIYYAPRQHDMHQMIKSTSI